MREDSLKLLLECNKGCKMAIGSMDQLLQYVRDEELKKIIIGYKDKHEKLEDESSELLKECGQEEKSPGVMAEAMSWFSTEMKMFMEDDNHQIAKILMDGCNMGIQSVCKYQNQYPEASRESLSLAKRLVHVEEDLMEELKKFL